MSQSFYLYKNRTNPTKIGVSTLLSGIGYLTISLTLLVISIVMILNNNIQYVIRFEKLH